MEPPHSCGDNAPALHKTDRDRNCLGFGPAASRASAIAQRIHCASPWQGLKAFLRMNARLPLLRTGHIPDRSERDGWLAKRTRAHARTIQQARADESIRQVKNKSRSLNAQKLDVVDQVSGRVKTVCWLFTKG